MSLLPSLLGSPVTDSLRWVWSQMVPHCLLLPELSLCLPITILALRFSWIPPVAQKDAEEQGLGPSDQTWVLPGATRPCDTAHFVPYCLTG